MFPHPVTPLALPEKPYASSPTGSTLRTGLLLRVRTNWTQLRQARWFQMATEMAASRGLTTVMSAASAVWVSRCLGPHNLGISGSVQNVAQQSQLLVTLNQDTGLLRSYKEAADNDARNRMLSGILMFRLLLLSVVLTTAVVVMATTKMSAEWRWAWWFFFPLLGSLIFPTGWLFQAQDRTNLDFRVGMLSATLSLVGFLIWLRAGARAGETLAVTAAVQVIVGLLSWRWVLHGRHRLSLTLSNLKAYLPELWRGRWLMLSGFVALVYIYLQTPLLALLQSEATAGLYRSAEQAVGAAGPFFAIVATIMYPRFVTWAKEGPAKLWDRQMRILRWLAVGVVPVALAGILLAPFAFRLVLGEQFLPAAVPFSILFVARCVNMLGGVFVWALYAQHQDYRMLMLLVLVSATSLTLNLLAIPRFGGLGAATVSLLCEILIFVGAFWLCRRAARQARAGSQ